MGMGAGAGTGGWYCGIGAGAGIEGGNCCWLYCGAAGGIWGAGAVGGIIGATGGIIGAAGGIIGATGGIIGAAGGKNVSIGVVPASYRMCNIRRLEIEAL